MARQDILLDLDTEDLVISSVKGKFSSAEFFVDDVNSLIYLLVTIPSDLIKDSRWKNERIYVENTISTISGVDSYQLKVKYVYVASGGSEVELDSLDGYTYNGDGTYSTIDANHINLEIDSALLNNNHLCISYIERPDLNCFVVDTIGFGDFKIGNGITQNEYMLLKGNEGFLLQDPVAGVGIKNFINSPTNSQDLVEKVIDKFKQDLLQVVNIEQTDEGLLRIESQDINRVNV